MDVDRYAFQKRLPLILKAIATSRFVTFDFELSGIPGKQTGQPRAPGRSEDGKQTLQERYEETKKAAERYQILQLGLTCVEEDLERGTLFKPWYLSIEIDAVQAYTSPDHTISS